MAAATPCSGASDARAKEEVQGSKEKTVSLPNAASSSGNVASSDSNKKNERKTLNALIARAFYSGGISFNSSRNPYFREAILEVAELSLDEPELQAVPLYDVEDDMDPQHKMSQ